MQVQSVRYALDGFTVRAAGGWGDSGLFASILTLLREKKGEILVDVSEGKRKRIVLKAEIQGRMVIVKREFFIFRFDRSVKAYLFGSNARSVFSVSKSAFENGFSGIPHFFLCAERFERGVLRECISVMEFLKGDSLPWNVPLPEEIRAEICSLVNGCHAHGIISGDIHPGNFIKTENGLKLIDFCGKKVFPSLAKARDRAQLGRRFGIRFSEVRWSDRLFRAILAWRNFGRRLRGQDPLPD